MQFLLLFFVCIFSASALPVGGDSGTQQTFNFRPGDMISGTFTSPSLETRATGDAIVASSKNSDISNVLLVVDTWLSPTVTYPLVLLAKDQVAFNGRFILISENLQTLPGESYTVTHPDMIEEDRIVNLDQLFQRRPLTQPQVAEGSIIYTVVPHAKPHNSNHLTECVVLSDIRVPGQFNRILKSRFLWSSGRGFNPLSDTVLESIQPHDGYLYRVAKDTVNPTSLTSFLTKWENTRTRESPVTQPVASGSNAVYGDTFSNPPVQPNEIARLSGHTQAPSGHSSISRPNPNPLSQDHVPVNTGQAQVFTGFEHSSGPSTSSRGKCPVSTGSSTIHGHNIVQLQGGKDLEGRIIQSGDQQLPLSIIVHFDEQNGLYKLANMALIDKPEHHGLDVVYLQNGKYAWVSSPYTCQLLDRVYVLESLFVSSSGLEMLKTRPIWNGHEPTLSYASSLSGALGKSQGT